MFGLCFTDDASKYFDLELSYITASPLGVPQQVTFRALWTTVLASENVEIIVSCLNVVQIQTRVLDFCGQVCVFLLFELVK